eukprot:SAG31_NODE_37015_length_308_cov_0.741627_1_plen_61_part_10
MGGFSRAPEASEREPSDRAPFASPAGDGLVALVGAARTCTALEPLGLGPLGRLASAGGIST